MSCTTLKREDLKRIQNEIQKECTLELTPQEQDELTNGDGYTREDVATSYAQAVDDLVPWEV